MIAHERSCYKKNGMIIMCVLLTSPQVMDTISLREKATIHTFPKWECEAMEQMQGVLWLN